MKRIFSTVVISMLAACATAPNREAGDGIARVNPASVAGSPATWDGRQVEMVGLLVWESDRLGLYQSYGAYCRAAEKAGIHVGWQGWPGVSRADNLRRVVVRGVFRNISAGAPGPGLLEPGTVVRWLSPPMKPCPVTRP